MPNGITANYLGKLYDWGSITLSMLNDIQIGINKIDISNKRMSKNIYGFGQQPIGYINNNFEYSCSIGLLYDQFQSITVAALALGITPMEIPPFSISMTLGSTQDPLVPYKVITLQNCRFTNDNFSAKQNDGGFYNDYQIEFAGMVIGFA